MTSTAQLREEHARILRQASLLAGLARGRMTADVAAQARRVVSGIDGILMSHLECEDDWLYPTLAASEEPDVRAVAAQCVEDMGAILGAWTAYRDRWTEASILADPARFQSATEGIVGALAIRIEMENTRLYQLFDAHLASVPSVGRAG